MKGSIGSDKERSDRCKWYGREFQFAQMGLIPANRSVRMKIEFFPILKKNLTGFEWSLKNKFLFLIGTSGRTP